MAGFISVARSQSSIISRKVLDDAKAAEGAGKSNLACIYAGLPIMSSSLNVWSMARINLFTRTNFAKKRNLFNIYFQALYV